MKSKLFKILGVIAVVAMIAAAIVAPVSATVTGVTVTVAAHPATDGDISTVGKYSIFATLGTQLLGSRSTISLPYVGDAVSFVSAASTDKITIGITSGTISVSNAALYTAGTGVIQFTSATQTETITATAANTVFTVTQNVGTSGMSAYSVGTDQSTAAPPTYTGTNITMPAVGESIVFTSAAATDTVILGVPTTGALTNISVAWSGTAGTYSNTTGIITFTAIGQTATISANAAFASPWTKTGSPTGAITPVVAIANTGTTNTITVTFPAGFTVAASSSIVATLAAGTGWVTYLGATTPASLPANIPTTPAVAWSSSTTLLTVTATLPWGDYIGANAQVLIYISGGVTNPSTAGSYTLTVATSAETTAVTSAAFAITNPVPPVVSGVASIYNNATTPILMTQYNSLDLAIKYVVTNAVAGATIKLSAGTYADVTGTYSPTTAITIQGTDASAANVIIQGLAAWGITGTTIVIDSVTIDGTNGALTLVATGSGSATLSNSIINNKNAVNIGATGTGTSNITKDTFTVNTGKNGLVPTSATTVTGSTFTITGTGWGINSANNVTVSGCTFTGVAATAPTYTGQGINLTGGSGSGSTIGTSTFTGLSNALTCGTLVNVNFNGNTVTACGMTTPTGVDAIQVNSVGLTYGVYILNNKITNSLEYIVSVALGCDNLVYVNDNQFTGNVKNAATAGNFVALTPLNVTHNYWGGTALNPASVTTTGKLIDYSNPIGAVPSAAASTTATKLDATAAVGVNITATVGGPTQLGASALAGNPVGPALPSTVTVVKYFDVFGLGAGLTGATIDFYGATAASITANSAIYFYNTAYGTWQLCSAQTINAFGNYVEVTLSTTGPTAPTIAQFAGLPFALVTVPTTLGAPTPGAGTISPTNGATGVPVSGVTFTWPVVTPPAGSTITYQFALAQASANTSANEFAILDYSDNSITNAEPNQETLQYNTVYWWEVRAVTMSSTGAITATGPWTISMFTTAPQAPATTPAVTTVVSSVTTVVTTNVNVTSPVTTITFTQPTPPASTPVIPSYLLWAVIAVGAILVIAVIVLIVRTRRIP
jgi:hypothetical protein